MTAKKARNYFLGVDGNRYGCAQAVAKALSDHCKLNDDFMNSMANATGGKAPNGYCGALYASLQIADEHFPEKKEAIISDFALEAGGTTCKSIRELKLLKCADCVEKATQLTIKHSQNK